MSMPPCVYDGPLGLLYTNHARVSAAAPGTSRSPAARRPLGLINNEPCAHQRHGAWRQAQPCRAAPSAAALPRVRSLDRVRVIP